MEDRPEVDLRQLLRSETAALHQRTEAAVAEQTPLTDRVGYARFLVAMREVYRKFGSDLARGGELAGCGAAIVPAVVAAIAEDLGKLGGDPMPVSRWAPAEDRGPVLRADDARTLGVLYVFEGSAHGAAVLHAQLAAHYGANARLAYFGLLREHGPRRWPLVLAALRAPPATEDPEHVLAGARDAFAGILAAISRQGGRSE